MFNFLKNKNGSFSLTRIGAALVSLAGIIITLPAAGVSIPVAVIVGAKVVGSIAVAVGANGLRNAVQNTNQTATK